MATYNPIGNTEVDAESPITASLMSRLRDNPLAIQEGASGAPRIVTAALADAAVTAAKLNADTREIFGTSSQGKVLINGAISIQWIKFSGLGPSQQQTFNWTAPFGLVLWYAGAALNFTGFTAPGVIAANVAVISSDLTQITIKNTQLSGSDNLAGHILGIGV